MKQAVIDELANELEDECLNWTHIDSYDLDHEDFYEIDAALDEQKPLVNLTQSLFRLRRLLAEKDNLDQSLHRYSELRWSPDVNPSLREDPGGN